MIIITVVVVAVICEGGWESDSVIMLSSHVKSQAQAMHL